MNLNELLAKMTLEEKVAQVCAVYVGRTPDGSFSSLSDAEKRKMFPHGIGQVCQPGKRRSPGEIVDFGNDIQQFLVKHTRLGIPAILHEEGLHGMIANGVTCLPVPVAIAASWNEELVQKAFDRVGRELRIVGIHQALSPVLDVAREPRWGRFEETFGEDPHLVSRMGVAAVKGFQGDGKDVDSHHVVATGKHFCGYSEPESGTNAGPYARDTRTLYEAFFPSFRAAVAEAHLKSVMPSYNEIAGVPSHGNRWLLQTVLREEMGFDGIVVADYGGVAEMRRLHHVAASEADAAVLAVNAGVDFDLPNNTAYCHLESLVRNGRVSEKQLDEMVLRVLRIKKMLGLFDRPYAEKAPAELFVGDEDGRKLSAELARQCAVLLRNDNALLPLRPENIRKLAVIGPNAGENVLGAYYGTPRQSVTPVEGIRTMLAGKTEVLYAEGCRITITLEQMHRELNLEDPGKDHNLMALSSAELDRDRIAAAVETAKQADVVVLCVGGNMYTSGESFFDHPRGDRASLELLGGQRALLEALLAAGKPLVVCLIHGGPVGDELLFSKAHTLLDCSYLGSEAGTVIAEILFGKTNPSGKLPYSVPRSAGHIPSYYNYKPSARRGYGYANIQPAFAFGHGLSYTTFCLDKLRLSSSTIRMGESAEVSVEVTNTGRTAGAEVVQLYIRDEVSSVTRPVKELKGYRKVFLEPGKKEIVTFSIGRRELEFYNADLQCVVEPGTFRIMVGTSSRDADLMQMELVVTE
jgi:beta-glucosidase